jgi:hypothetical protein
MALSGMAVFEGVLALITFHPSLSLWILLPNVFVLWVLYTRRELFD